MASPVWMPGSFAASLSFTLSDALLRLGTRRTFAAGRPLLLEGDYNDHVELITQGCVKVTSVSADGTVTLLAVRVAGDVVGESAGLTGRPRSATVTAMRAVTSYFMRATDFQRFLEANPVAAVKLAAAMSRRLEFANQRRSDFAAYDAEVRLARVLVDLAELCGRTTEAGLSIDGLTQPEIASMAGLANPTAERALGAYRERDLVDTGYRRVIILDMPGLRQLANSERSSDVGVTPAPPAPRPAL